MSDTSNGRVVEVINFLATHPTESFRLSEIAENLGLSHGSAHRVLTTLTQAGYLLRHPKHKTYTLGIALVMIGQAALAQHRSIDIARREMARLCEDTRAQCSAYAIADGELLLVAKEGAAQSHTGLGRVGEHRPFVPPLGLTHVAWSAQATLDTYLAGAPVQAGAKIAAYCRQSLEMVRARGYSIVANGPHVSALLRALAERPAARRDETYWAEIGKLIETLTQPEIQMKNLAETVPDGVFQISAPVFGPGGNVDLELTLSGFAPGVSVSELERYTARLCAAAALTSAEAHGQSPSGYPAAPTVRRA
ncbi:DNA-binding IclR family transcriptional regulator [Novosphingobium sp. PhB165]|uniref:helix-turn-helix domain-containing protein n=1 Tax=Novosphingobium sp. PhB165 TaxID=2485105 RepID=UPI00104E06EE|nr:helix-turn-helix domain-containing protein [Novosphingobium sp. PhB165]TCM16592.1 DNA-binding IclR family transcriptional regulator [Novosphingobium sp. PhB165]